MNVERDVQLRHEERSVSENPEAEPCKHDNTNTVPETEDALAKTLAKTTKQEAAVTVKPSGIDEEGRKFVASSFKIDTNTVHCYNTCASKDCWNLTIQVSSSALARKQIDFTISGLQIGN